MTISDVLQLSSQRVEEFTASQQPHLAKLHVFRHGSMCILDPFEVTHNVNPHGGPPLLRNFINSCHSTALLCQSAWRKNATASVETQDKCSALDAPPLSEDSYWGLAQVIAQPSAPGLRYVSVFLSADQVHALCAASGHHCSSATMQDILQSTVDFLTKHFGFATECTPVPESESDPSTMELFNKDSDEEEVGQRATPGKVRRASFTGHAAKRMYGSSSASTELLGSRFQAYCQAHVNTWRHRRRFRRETQRNLVGDEQGTSATSAMVANTSASKVQLAFKLHLFPDLSRSGQVVVFQPTKSEYMNELHSFTAVFRKDLQQMTSSTSASLKGQ